ncbi:MAG TPA: ribosomal protein L7/L12 [Ramlibacter sp.]|uniref:ribosomal protein L7/L12 n=1 Tax=Ramlibacter sp. TaxID=1917967 RepID=UPI002D1093FA|nr:ribosomal protein L7/L12 [Ramlibacter sp.]HVZ46245.1 ribosomal protein L7/L12 [Ramlibacter sp.]
MSDSTVKPTLSPAAVAALQQGNKIEAIKILREERNIGLKEAKDAVDDYVRSQPALQAAMAEARPGLPSVFWIVVVAALAALAWRFFFKG